MRYVPTSKQNSFFNSIKKLPKDSTVDFDVVYDEVYKTKENPEGKMEMAVASHKKGKDYFICENDNWVYLTSKSW